MRVTINITVFQRRFSDPLFDVLIQVVPVQCRFHCDVLPMQPCSLIMSSRTFEEILNTSRQCFAPAIFRISTVRRVVAHEAQGT